MENSRDEIRALYADEDGNIFDVPGYAAIGRSGEREVALTADDLVPLPEGSDLMLLPGRQAVGLSEDGEILPIVGQAVAAIIPPGYTRTHMPAYRKERGDLDPLPLYGYTAAALYRDELCVAALYTDDNDKWNPAHYNTKNLKKLINHVKKDLPNNRLVAHLARCATEWHCQTAENLFYRRWEAGIPVSPVCNAKCLGCISLQSAECCPAPQSRITFRPTAEEIAAIGIYHLSFAPEAIISFGQGCEGEPSLAAGTIAPAIAAIRAETDKGQININTNGGFIQGLKKIIDAGLDTMRVSIISARDEVYDAYYRASYKLAAVAETIDYAREKGVFVSLNLLYFPGFSDRAEEVAAWEDFVRAHQIDMVQLRNLNLDPDYFLAAMPPAKSEAIGTKAFIERLKAARDGLVVGSFSHFVK